MNGSDNKDSKIKESMKASLMAFNKAEYVLPVVKENKASGGYLTWGDDNQYPIFLRDMFYNSAVHSALILGKRDFICGEGLESESGDKAIQDFIESCNRRGDSLDDIFRKCVLDYEIYGGFTLQIVYERIGGRIAEINYVSIPNFRFNLEADKLKYAKDWSKRGGIKVIEYDLYDESDKTGTKIFYYRGDLTTDQYPIPYYTSSAAAIETDIEITNFHLQSIKNGLFPSMMINFRNGQPETEEEEAAIEAKINKKFGGSSNTGKLLLSFSDSDNDSPEIIPIQQPDLDKMFTILKESVRDSIFVGHRISAPNVFGVMTAGKLGNTEEFRQGVQVFMRTYVKSARKVLLRIFNRILSTNFENADLRIKDSEQIDIEFRDESIITANMTREEVRKKLKKEGFIDSVEIPDGQVVIGDLDKEKPSTDTNEPVEDNKEDINE